MLNPARTRGFSLIEILLVLTIIGIISGIAIPSYMGQRRRARVIGDAMSNARVLQMGLESLKSDTGVYGAVAAYDWKADGSATSGPTLIPGFQPSGNSKMDFNVNVTSNGIAYTLTVTDSSMGGATVYQTNQLGKQLFRMQ